MPSDKPRKSWSLQNRDGAVIRVIDGGHFNVMAMPAVSGIATELRQHWRLNEHTSEARIVEVSVAVD